MGPARQNLAGLFLCLMCSINLFLNDEKVAKELDSHPQYSYPFAQRSYYLCARQEYLLA